MCGNWRVARKKPDCKCCKLDRLSTLAAAPPAELVDLDFLRVRIQGVFEGDKYFLVDNQVVNGRAGYWVVQSFLARSGKRWLVNRGWVDGGARRAEFPEIPQPGSTLELVGVCWPDLGLLPMLSEEVWSSGWPKRVPRMNIARMAAALDAAAVEIRLEAGQPGRLGALPMSVVMDAPRHRAMRSSGSVWF